MTNIIPISPNSQSLVQMSAWIVSGLRELLYWSRTHPLALKVDLDATVDTGIVRISRAMEASSGYLNWFDFQNSKTFNFDVLSTCETHNTWPQTNHTHTQII